MRHIASLFIVIALVGACGSEPEVSPPTGGGGASADFPVTIETAAGPVVIDERPDRIVSLSPTATEMLFAIDADDQVVAVDDQSNFPPSVPTTDLSGFEPNIEAIASYEPDLVVASDGNALKGLKKLKIDLLVQPAATVLDDTYQQIEDLGAATGQVDGATALVASMKEDITEIVAGVPDLEKAPTYYHELDDTYFSVTSETFIGQVYDLVGLKNIADKAKGAGTGYPQLSSEYIIQANPDFVFLADTKCCNQNASTVADRPGWKQLDAVQDDRVVELDDDIASRWGPRVVDLLTIVVDAIEGSSLGSM